MISNPHLPLPYTYGIQPIICKRGIITSQKYRNIFLSCILHSIQISTQSSIVAMLPGLFRTLLILNLLHPDVLSADIATDIHQEREGMLNEPVHITQFLLND